MANIASNELNPSLETQECRIFSKSLFLLPINRHI